MIAGLVVILAPVNMMYQQSNRYKNQNYELAKYQSVPYQIEIANFGSSHGQLGFYYDHDGVNSFNFALSSQTPEYDLVLLKDNLDHFAEGAKIIFPISYFTPYLFPQDQDDDFELRNQRYYRILSPFHIIDFDLIQWIKENLSVPNGKELINLKALFDDDELFYELTNQKGNFPLSNWENVNLVNGMDLSYEANLRWEFWMQYRANLDLDRTGTMNPEVITIYQEIVKICEKNNLIPIFVTLPITSELNEVIDEKFYPIFKEDVRIMMEMIGKPLYLDYSHNEDFSYNQEYFIDTDHLSKFGADAFTNLLIEDIDRNLNRE